MRNPEHARAESRRRKAHAHGCRLAVESAASPPASRRCGLHLRRRAHRLAGVAGLRDERVDRRDLPLSAAAGSTRGQSARLFVRDSRPSPTVKQDVGRLHREQRVQSSASVVSAPSVTTTVPRAADRPAPAARRRCGADSRLRAGERELGGRRQALREQRSGAARREPAGQRLQDVGVPATRSAASRTRSAACRRRPQSACCASRPRARQENSAGEQPPSPRAPAGKGRRAQQQRARGGCREDGSVARRPSLRVRRSVRIVTAMAATTTAAAMNDPVVGTKRNHPAERRPAVN